jgi:UDP-2-acetamido-3-amino-2,3-dideoxy-glucuronate N-acetyltransferase
MNIDYYLHPTAVVESGAQIGKDTAVWHWVHVCATAKIGEHCILGQNVFIGNDVTIGNGVKIQNNVSVYTGVTLEDDVFCGPSAVFTNVINPRSFINRKDSFLPTLVKRGATIGANATIICGHTIGCYALIGAGSVVTKDVSDYALMVGNPIRQIGWICRCGERLPQKMAEVTCSACGQNFRLSLHNCQKL